MLKKINTVNSQNPNRLWYSDGYFDLIVWKNDQKIDAFQLCYDIKRRERVLSWSKTFGFSHSQIDSGEQTPSKNQSPLFVADGVLNHQAIIEKFNAHAQNIEKEIRDFIIDKLKIYKNIP